MVKTEQFQGYSGNCEKWRHKCADGRKRIADGKSNGGAAAASVDNDGEVQAVMEVEDAVMEIDDEGTSTWLVLCCYQSSSTVDVTSICAHRSLLT